MNCPLAEDQCCAQQAVDPEAETEDDSDGDHEPENGVRDRISTSTRAVERISKRVSFMVPIQS